MEKQEKKPLKFGAKVKEFFRKRLVSLKVNTHIIPLIFMIVTMLVFNLSLTKFSNSTAVINVPGMGFVTFIIVLCSYLSIITYLSAYPRHQKTRLFSIIVTIVMLVASIVCDALYHYYIRYGTEIKEGAIEPTAFTITASNVCIVHIILLSISILLIVTLPIYKKWLNKINTKVETDEIKIDKIDLSNE
ncbi:MAG: hypothetical protein K6F59_02150 [Gammaproteobacteria bacterium]|nr:hypothetical protein [Gammaproteobacteria bacterium]